MKHSTPPSGHEPVLLAEVLQHLAAGEGGSFLDATFGGGGHARAILSAHPGNRLFALDRDPAALPRADRFEQEFGSRFRFCSMNFARLGDLPPEAFDGILLDLGVSSFQLDEAFRGFSFRSPAPLDMRMDPNSGQSAAEFLETAPEDLLVEAIRDFGEEKFWRRVVSAILQQRGTGALQSTIGFARVVADAVPVTRPPSRIHPATRSFQGVRIAVNGELSALETVLPAAFERLAPGGRLVVISFHSLEDRIVKRFVRARAGRPEHAGDSRPQDERTVEAILPFSKAVRPSALEIERNPRSRSSRLRLVIKNSIP